MCRSITFLVTALNEQDHIVATAGTVLAAAQRLGCDYEIILVNDGSSDDTPRLIDRLAAENPCIRAIHNRHNLGLGGAYKRAIGLATKEHVMWICGDNSETVEHIVNIATHVGEADIVLPVLLAGRHRPLLRRAMSKAFTMCVNLLFGLRVRYYNGTVIHKTALVTQVPIRTNSFAYQAEALVKMLRAKCSYVEVPYSSRTYDGLFSNATKPRNLLAVMTALYHLFVDIHLKGFRLDLHPVEKQGKTVAAGKNDGPQA